MEMVKEKARTLLKEGYAPSKVAKELNISVKRLASWFPLEMSKS